MSDKVKKIVDGKIKLSSGRLVEIKEMSIDEIDACNDSAHIRFDENEKTFITGLARNRSMWLRKGIKGGEFDNFEVDKKGMVIDSVLKQLDDAEKNELSQRIQEFQSLGN